MMHKTARHEPRTPKPGPRNRDPETRTPSPGSRARFVAFASVFLLFTFHASRVTLRADAPELPKPWTAQVESADRRKVALTVWPAAPDAEGKSAPAILFVHGLGGSRADWEVHAPAFQRLGFASCAMDLAGHGETVGGAHGADAVRDARAYADLEAAVAFFLRRQEVDAARFLVVGADWGGLLAVRYAAEHPKRAAGLVLLSPRWAVRTVSIREHAAKTASPVLLAGAEAESAFGEIAEIRKAFEAREGKLPCDAVVLARADGPSGGTRLLEHAGGRKACAERILAWILDRTGIKK